MDKYIKPILTNNRIITKNIDIPEIFEQQTKRLTKKETIRENSVFINIFGILLIIIIAYFLYNIYIEGKLFSEYLNFIEEHERNNQDNYNIEPMPI